jgi:hypothetical protein
MKKREKYTSKKYGSQSKILLNRKNKENNFIIYCKSNLAMNRI